MARRIAALFLLMLWLPTAVLAQVPAVPGMAAPAAPAPVPAPAATPAAPPEAPAHDRWLPVVAGIGAIAGVVGFNIAALGLQALPGGLAYGTGAVVAAEMSVAMSRVYAVTSAVAGGLAGRFAYQEWGRDLETAAAGAAETAAA